MPRLSEQEIAVRRTGLGATDLVEVCGLAPWAGAGPMRVYCEKLGIAYADAAEEDPERADALDWGHRQEPVIAQWYEDRRGVELLIGGPVYSRDQPNFWATLDRVVVGANRLVEIKNVGSPHFFRHWDVSSQDGIPNYVRGQVTIAMHYHGARETDVVTSIGGRPPHVWTVFYDAELAEAMVRRGVAFWRSVQEGRPPALDHTDATRSLLLARWPTNRDPTMLEADDVTEQIGEARAAFAREEKDAARGKARLDAELMAKVGDATGVRGSFGSFTWKADASGKRRSRFTAGREVE